MTLAGDRTAIADALDAVTDVTGYDDWPPQMAVGDAWVRWAGHEAEGAPLIFLATWKVHVVSGGSPSDSMAWLDAHLASILDSIDQLVFITSVVPVEFQTPSGVLYGAEITAQKET